jgi:hypothetical protein
MNTNLGALGTCASLLLLFAVATGGEALANMQARLRGALDLPFRAEPCARSSGVQGAAGGCAVEGLWSAGRAWAEAADSPGAPQGDRQRADVTLDARDASAFVASSLSFGEAPRGVAMTLMAVAGADTHSPRLTAAAPAEVAPGDSALQPAPAGDVDDASDPTATSRRQVTGGQANGNEDNRQAAAGPIQTSPSTMDSGLFALVAWLALLALGGVGVGGFSRLFDGRSSGMGDRHPG